jgi:hypothetical protein
MIVSLPGAAAGASEDILGMLAEASSHMSQQWGVGGSSGVQVIEEDDVEFAYINGPVDGPDDPVYSGPPKQIIESGFLTAFADFLSGAKAETLSSVANSTVVRKTPQLPIAYVPEPSRKGHEDKNKTPMTIVLSESGGSQQVLYVNESGTPVSGRGAGSRGGRGRGRPPSRYVVQRYSAGSSALQKGKRKGSDSDSYDDEDELEASGYKIVTSNDLDKQLHADVRPPPVYRGRGRPRGSTLSRGAAAVGRGGGTVSNTSSSSDVSTPQPIVIAAPADSLNFHLNPTEPHNYQKGDFVIERKDSWKTEGFPIWRIETGKLLQKFDPLPIEGGLLHKSASVYSSWSGDIRTSFKAVLVDLITSSAGRKQETVRIQDKFLVKPAEDSLDEDPLFSTFIVFMHTMLSAAIDPAFLATILQNEEDEYYTSSVRQIDTLLMAATQSILSQITWNETFKLTADALPYYIMTNLAPNAEATYQCQACEDGVTPAVRSVKFYGVLYDRDLLTATQEVEKVSAQEFLIGKAASEILISYHALHHFKFLLFQKCQEETNYLRLARKLSETDAMSECLQNKIFLHHHFRELQSLLQQFIIVEHAVEPVSESSVTGDSQQTGDLAISSADSPMAEGYEQAGVVTTVAQLDMIQPDEAATAGSESAEPIGIEPMETSSGVGDGGGEQEMQQQQQEDQAVGADAAVSIMQ